MTSTKIIKTGISRILKIIAADSLPIRQNSGADAASGIGVVLDDFSMQCFKPEGTLWPIAIRDMEIALDRLSPEFMLIESAWNGNDGDWLYQITSPTGPKEDYFKLIEACRKRSIPSVFWNKEDPPHFEQFLPAASAADHIFTCEESLVDSYKAAAGHSNVNVMRFAAQPRLHVPFRNQNSRVGNIAFAGQYFAHKFPERREQMEILFPPASKIGLSIYSRVLGGDPNYAFPAKYEKYVVGSLPYSSMVQAYRDHKVFLNVNSVPESKSMCARRIFELSSSKTAVVSVVTTAITSSYADNEVFTVTSAKEASEVLHVLANDDDFRERAAHRAWRRTLREHTYEARLSEIRGQITGIDNLSNFTATAICLVSSAVSLDRLLNQISQQIVTPARVVVASASGAFSPNEQTVKDFCRETNIPVTLLESVESIKRIEPDTESVTVFSEYYDYGPHYLGDLSLYVKHLKFPDFVGKALTGDISKSTLDYVGDHWEEDVESESFLSGAWLSPTGLEWRDAIFSEVRSPGGQVRLGRKIRVSDRFNVRLTSIINNNSWIV